MTKASAMAKARRYAANLNDVTVITNGLNYEVIHTEYLDEYIEDGWAKVASYKYDFKVTRY